jgi:hypothetical protein
MEEILPHQKDASSPINGINMDKLPINWRRTSQPSTLITYSPVVPHKAVAEVSKIGNL